MISYKEIYERALNGPSVKEQYFDLHMLYPKINALVHRYQIEYETETPVPSNNELAENVFRAAVDFLNEVGVYCRDTNRLIKFSRNEIDKVIKYSPNECFFGEGRERKPFTSRKPDDDKLPWCHVGSGSVVSTEEIASKLIQGYANIPQVDSIAIPALPSKSGTPMEISDAIKTVKIGRASLKLAGRPGLPILNLLSTAGTTLATIAASNPDFGLRPSDGWLIGMIAEMKLEFGALKRAVYLQHWGGNIAAESSPMLGGYCGGPEGTAVLNAAYILAGRLCFQSNYHLTFPLHIKHSCSSTRNVLWAVSVSAQAISRNMDFPVLFLAYQAAGPFTRMYFYETAAYVLAAVTSGVSAQAPLPARATLIDHITPLEMKFSIELAHAAASLTRKDANKIVKRLLAKYEGDIEQAPEGKKYQECYDLKTEEPRPDYLRLYDEMKKELEEEGIEF